MGMTIVKNGLKYRFYKAGIFFEIVVKSLKNYLPLKEASFYRQNTIYGEFIEL